MKIGGIYAEIRARTSKLKKDLAGAERDVRSSAKKMSGSISSIGFKAAGIAATAFGVAFAAAVKRGIGAASDLEEATSKFNVVFKGQTKVALEWSNALVKSYGLSDRGARQYLSSVQDLLVPMGMQADSAARLSNEIVKLSVDLGSFNNLPTEQVMLDIQSALVGNFETMKKYGVVLNAAAVEQEIYNKGLARSKKDITAADKAQAAYNLIIKSSTAAMGDYSRTSDGYANSVKEMDSAWENFTANLVNKTGIFAAITDGVHLTTDALNGMNRALDRMGDIFDSLNARRGPSFIQALKDMAYWVDQFYKKTGDVLSGRRDPNTGRLLGQAADKFALQTAASQTLAQQQLRPPYISITPNNSLSYDHRSVDKLDRLEYPTELGASGAERGHMAQVAMNNELVRAIQLQNALALAVEDTYDIDAGTASDFTEDLEATYTHMVGLTERTADAMQENFSNVFFDAITGELKSFEDYATAIFESVARAFSDMMGQMVAQSIFGSDFGGGGGGGGGFLDMLGSLAGGLFTSTAGGGTVNWGGGQRAAGGPVYPSSTYLVGERGPELLHMGSAGGSITPNHELGGSTTNVTVNISAVDAKSVQELLVNNKGLIGGLVGSEAMRNQSLRSNIRAAAR